MVTETKEETHGRAGPRTRGRGGEPGGESHYPQSDIYLKRKIARARKWDSKWRRRSRVEQKKRGALPRQGTVVERKDVEKELSDSLCLRGLERQLSLLSMSLRR